MTDRFIIILVAVCAILLGTIGIEFASGGPDDTASTPLQIQGETKPAPRAPEPSVDDIVATVLAAPLFSPTRQPKKPDEGLATDTNLRDLRLSGIVIEPERRIAIFAATGAKPLARSPGEAINDWQIESISPQEVLLSGPTGNLTFEPKPDKNLSRPSAPVAPATPPKANPPSGNSVASPSGAPMAAAGLARTLPPQPPLPPRPANRSPGASSVEKPTKRQ
jgi:general secretion pathway protein N